MTLQVFHGWKDLPPQAKGAALAFGSFDGVHRGHQLVIADAARAAARIGAPLGMISFEPNPRLHFEPDQPPFRLMTPGQLARTLDKLGVDRLNLLPFGTEMAEFSDREFVETVLVQGLGVRHLAVGFDVTFGKGRTGDPDRNQAAVVYWFQLVRGPGGAVDFVPHLIDNSSGVGTQVVVGDVNKDGLPDIVVGNKKGTFVQLHETKTVSPAEWEKAQPRALDAQ